ncbi:MAG TPA: hypothetical protein VIH67_15265 [Candidatus Acidoferrum sp.]
MLDLYLNSVGTALPKWSQQQGRIPMSLKYKAASLLKRLLFLVTPFAGNVLRKRRNFVGELCERVEPSTNLFGAAQGRWCQATSLASKNFFDVGLYPDPSRLRLGGDLVGNLDLDFHNEGCGRGGFFTG